MKYHTTMTRIDRINGAATVIALLASFAFMCAEDASLGWYIATGTIFIISGIAALVTGRRA